MGHLGSHWEAVMKSSFWNHQSNKGPKGPRAQGFSGFWDAQWHKSSDQHVFYVCFGWMVSNLCYFSTKLASSGYLTWQWAIRDIMRNIIHCVLFFHRQLVAIDHLPCPSISIHFHPFPSIDLSHPYDGFHLIYQPFISCIFQVINDLDKLQ